jgi:hypothetical protein
MDHPAGSAAPQSDRVAGSGSRRPAYRRAFRVGMGLSAAVHVVALLVYPSLVQRSTTAPVPFSLPSGGGTAPGMTVITVVTVEDEALVERPDEPDVIETIEEPAAVPGPPTLEGVPGRGLVAPGPTAAERLQPHLRDARLWRPLDPELNELTLEQRLELELATRVTAINDSMNAVAEAERALTDWTYTDSEGKRWGVTPGKIHLGDLTIPLPFGFGTPVGKERAQAIRERRDRERAAARPDTSGVRR